METMLEGWGVEVTAERAKQVKQWRADPNCTWRAVAHTADREWGTTSGGNQIFGRDLCNHSARMLGEDPNAEPWN